MGSKDYVKDDDKAKYDTQIRRIDEKTYKLLLNRRLEAAEELCEVDSRSLDNDAKRTYLAANSDKGKNYKLYNQLIKKIDNAHAGNEYFQKWKKEFLNTKKDAEKTIADADKIMTEGESGRNAYLISDDESRNRGKTATNNKDYYKKIYRKKKSRLDRMVAILRKGSINAQNNNAKTNLIDLSDEDSNELIPKELSENDAQNSGKTRPQSNVNIISSGMKEKNDEISLSAEGMNENIISTNSKDLEESDNASISKGSLVQKVQEFADKQKRLDAKNSDDPNEIRHQPGLISNEVLEEFAPASLTMNFYKDRSGKGKFGNNIIKAGSGLAQLGVGLHDKNLLLGDNLLPGYITPSISNVSGGIGAGLGLIGAVTGGADTYRNIRNVSAGGSHIDWVTSRMDTLGALGDTATGAATVMKSLGNIHGIGSSIANVGSAAGNVIPGLNIATGTISIVTGGIESIRGQRSLNTIDDQMSALKQQKVSGKLKEDQDKLEQIFKQGRRVGELHRTGGFMKVVGGSIALGTGIALLTGPVAPITAAILGVAGAAAGITNFVYSRKKKNNLRRDVTAQELGFTDWEAEKRRVRDRFPGEKLSNDEVKEIILKSKGYDVKTRKEAFKQINLKRAGTLIRIAEDGDHPLRNLADKVIGAMGVHRKGDRYAGGAQKLLAEKMAG